MQNGRLYRAAAPRGSTPWFPWNNRAPNRVVLRGAFSYSSAEVTIPNPTISGQSSYEFATGIFTWSGAFSAGLLDFTFSILQSPWAGQPGYKLLVLFADSFASLLSVEYDLLEGQIFPWGNILFPIIDPTFVTATGFFDGPSILGLVPCTYHEEP